ncbi:hypothetical protein BDN70DRAFT_95003 [Pholiota conissans]|uniref:Uncharacterized protein n=1 Tax=Pholiota conissans TaxID=109636 RepID=A0A9P5Z0W7_9AGAR|nr:hypothetical protein BDN70DRAFT_95003 [Pholiota conissans]
MLSLLAWPVDLAGFHYFTTFLQTWQCVAPASPPFPVQREYRIFNVDLKSEESGYTCAIFAAIRNSYALLHDGVDDSNATGGETL